MPPAARFALAAAVLAALSRLAAQASEGSRRDATPNESSVEAPSPVGPSVSRAAGATHCSRGTLPDNGVCVPVPAQRPAEAAAAGLAEPSGSEQHIPKRPERPAELDEYVWPLAGVPSTAELTAATEPDAGSTGRHGVGLRLAAPAQPDVRAASLEEPLSPAEVLHAGPLAVLGHTVVTLQRVREVGRERDYLIVYGQLSQIAPELRHGQRLASGALVGQADRQRGLYFEVRRLRDGVEVRALAPGQLLDPARSIATDPRNVLALAP